jgi:isochorismatase
MAEALLVVDVQRGFLHPQLPARNNDGAEEKMQKIMEDFRCSGREIIHIQHRGTDSSSFFYDEENIRFQSGFEPRVGEKVFTKNVNSAFIGTNLLAYLRERRIDRLTVMGCTLPHCVSTTVRMAANYGFQVTLVEDACVTFALSDGAGDFLSPEMVHLYNIAALRDEFATIVSAQQVLEKYI